MLDGGARELLLHLFRTAVARAGPSRAVTDHLPPKPTGRCLIIGAGKASAEMAAAVEALWPDVALEGVVTTRYGHGATCTRVKVIEAGHPVPDENSLLAGLALQNVVRSAQPGDCIIALISGGGSACLALPEVGITLADKQVLTEKLLRSGAPISAINTVRKALSAIKGGRLAAIAGPVPIHNLIISDVPGDNPADIASGPTIPSRQRRNAALKILEEYRVGVPDNVKAVLVRPDDETMARPQDTVQIVASPALSLAAAAAAAEQSGCRPVILSDAMEGESVEVARSVATLVRQHHRHNSVRPLVLLSGGETSVTLPAACEASGGRNTEFQLGMALALDDLSGCWSLAADSDGIDGRSAAAGAIVTPDTLKRATEAGLNALQLLKAHRSFDFFERLGDLIVTGPTRTNVNDIRIQLIA